MTTDEMITTARFYACVGWKSLEFEERAYARTLIRRGYLRFDNGHLALAEKAVA